MLGSARSNILHIFFEVETRVSGVDIARIFLVILLQIYLSSFLKFLFEM